MREPQYVREAEALIGPAFANTELEEVLCFQGSADIDDELLLAREGVYIQALRILAAERLTDRRKLFDGKTLATAENVQTWNEEWTWGLTNDRVKAIGHEPQYAAALFAARTLLKRQNDSEHLASTHKWAHDKLRPHMHPYMSSILEFLQQEPISVTVTLNSGEQVTRPVHGAVVDAPTGAGKTGLIALTAQAAHIGETTRNEQGETSPQRALVVVPSVQSLLQLTGKIGKGWFHRAAPDLSLGLYYADEKTTSADVIVTTTKLFSRDFKDGKLNGTPVSLLMFDEGQHLIGPQVLNTFLTQWRGPTVAFTATPSYNETKDIRSVLPHTIKHGDLLSYMCEGILNKAQVFSILAEPQYDQSLIRAMSAKGTELSQEDADLLVQESVEQCAIDFHLPLIREGRRGIIFCKAGNGAQHAYDLAEKFRGCEVNDRPVRAATLSDSRREGEPTNRQVLLAYERGEIDVLTAVHWGSESLDTDIDFVGIAANITSEVKLKQIIGRGTRPGQFPVTVYTHIIPRDLKPNYKNIWMHHGFGLDRIEQGVLIGEAPPQRSRISYDERKQNSVSLTHSFPESIRKLITKVEGRSLSSIYLMYDGLEQVPQGYLRLDKIRKSGAADLDQEVVLKKLEAEGYHYVGVVAITRRGPAIRYFVEPSAETLFLTKDQLPNAFEGSKTVASVAKELGISRIIIDNLLLKMRRETTLRVERRVAANGNVRPHVNLEAQAWLARAAAALPRADSTDSTYVQITRQLNMDRNVLRKRLAKLDINPTYKRNANGVGFNWYLTADETARITNFATTRIWAKDDEWNVPRIAKATGMSETTVHKHLKEDRELAQRKWTTLANGLERELDHWSPSAGRAIVERLQRYKEDFNVTPIIGRNEWAIAHISAFLGFKASDHAMRLLTDEERAALKPRRVREGGNRWRIRNCLDETHVRAIVARHRQGRSPIPPHVITLAAAEQIVRVTDSFASNTYTPHSGWLTQHKPPVGRTLATLSWQKLRELQQKYGLRDRIEPIDYERLPTGPDDADPARIAYAREVQRQFIALNQLEMDDILKRPSNGND